MAPAVWMVLIALLSTAKGDVSDEAFQESRLHEELFGNRTEMDAHTTPYDASNETTTIELGLSLIRILELDVKTSTLEAEIWIRLFWYDYGLHWNESDYEGLKAIRVSSRLVWTPAFIVENSAEVESSKLGSGKYNILIFPNGRTLWIPSRRLKTTCTLQTLNFPFDHHECYWKFSPQSEGGEDLKIQLFGKEEEIDMNDYSEAGEWVVLGSTAEMENDHDTTFTVHLRRRSGYYVFSLLLPLLAMWGLVLASFWLPPATQGKATMAAFCSLYLIILIINIYYLIPHNGSGVPRILLFGGTSLVFAFLALLLALISVPLGRDRTSPLPTCLSWLVSDSCARLLCLAAPPKQVSLGARFDARKAEVTVTEEQPASTKEVKQGAWTLALTALNRICFIAFCIAFIVLLLSCVLA